MTKAYKLVGMMYQQACNPEVQLPLEDPYKKDYSKLIKQPQS